MQYGIHWIRNAAQMGVDRSKSVVRTWIESPQILRQLIRDSQWWQILCCTGLGMVVGVVIALLHEMVQFLHRWMFNLHSEERLSAALDIDTMLIWLVPILGGLAVGVNNLLLDKWRSKEIVDPIEANAVLGGRMSMRDNLKLLWLSLLSNGSGASMGMEAAYTQMGSGILSSVGKVLQLRREDLRVFVAAGAAAAIAAAFNAPLAGAFYAFELILGSYTIAALPPVALSALASALTMRVLSGNEPIFELTRGLSEIPDWNYPVFFLMGIMAAGIGIATMKMTTFFEQFGTRLHAPNWIRPAIGGTVLAFLASLSPQVLGSGQGAIMMHLEGQFPVLLVLSLLVLKMIASAVSVGSGFRGGLFSAALFIGCLFGQMVGILISAVHPLEPEGIQCFMLVGMGAVATSIIGAPIAMVMLVLELTGSFPDTTGVIVGVLVASFITRQSFGYSFSTWRFHLRGRRITSGADISWMNELMVEQLLRSDPKTVRDTMSLAALREETPAGSTRRLFVLDDNGFYLGMLDVPSLHSHDLDKKLDELCARDLVHSREAFLTPNQGIQEALFSFKAAQQEVLPVLASVDSHQLIGYVSESYALRRYADALEQHNMRQSLAGTPLSSKT